MKKTRMISIKRTVSVEVSDKKGGKKIQKEAHWFPYRINNSVPSDHQMCE